MTDIDHRHWTTLAAPTGTEFDGPIGPRHVASSARST